MLGRIPLIAIPAAALFSAMTAVASESNTRAVMGNVRQTRYGENGEVVAVIEAERASVDAEGVLTLENVGATLYADDGEEVKIRASKGKTGTGGGADAVFEGGLELRFSGFVATTSRATWSESDKTVRGSEEIVLHKGASRVVGSGFTVHTADDRIVIYRPRGVVQLEDSRRDSENKKN